MRSAWDLDSPREAWRLHAACGSSPDMWTNSTSPASPGAELAMHICRRHCPVLAQCSAETAETPPDRRKGVILAGDYYTDRGELHGKGLVQSDSCSNCGGRQESAVARRRRTWRESQQRRRSMSPEILRETSRETSGGAKTSEGDATVAA